MPRHSAPCCGITTFVFWYRPSSRSLEIMVSLSYNWSNMVMVLCALKEKRQLCLLDVFDELVVEFTFAATPKREVGGYVKHMGIVNLIAVPLWCSPVKSVHFLYKLAHEWTGLGKPIFFQNNLSNFLVYLLFLRLYVEVFLILCGEISYLYCAQLCWIRAVFTSSLLLPALVLRDRQLRLHMGTSFVKCVFPEAATLCICCDPFFVFLGLVLS